MGAARHTCATALRLAAGLAACVAVSSCVTGAKAPPSQAALFKSQVGDIAGGVAPGPHSVWYVQRLPVSYVKIGVATWRPERPAHGVRSWFARLFGHRPAAPSSGEPTAIAAASLGLPVPSKVQVTNVATGAMVTVRVDDKAPMGDGIIQLTPEVARGLGVDPGTPLLVRVRYLAPVVAYNQRPSLRYALRGPIRATAKPAPVMVAAQARPVVPAAPVPSPPEVIRASAALPPVAVPPPSPPVKPATQPVVTAPLARNPFRVQAGAFASMANARHAVAMLEPTGAATIEPMKRGDLTLYRVIVTGPAEPAAAERLRARVAEIGFADARLIRPL